MNGRGAEFFQQTAMLGRWITFVRSELVTRMHGIEFSHQRVASSFSDDRSGSDAG